MAKRSEEGYVGIFGDNLDIHSIGKRNGVLNDTKVINNAGKDIGMSTENGVWLFFDDAIKNKKHYDNIVIFSDQQAGHGGLYGTNESRNIYKKLGYSCDGFFINVMDLINEYRKQVNPKVNVMTVQTAGYDNVVIPENIYRGIVTAGWTGKETTLLYETTKIWDEAEKNANS